MSEQFKWVDYDTWSGMTTRVNSWSTASTTSGTGLLDSINSNGVTYYTGSQGWKEISDALDEYYKTIQPVYSWNIPGYGKIPTRRTEMLMSKIRVL